MAKRYYKVRTSMGYCGTGTEEKLDLVEDWGYNEEYVEGMSQEEADKEIYQGFYEECCERISVGFEAIDEV